MRRILFRRFRFLSFAFFAALTFAPTPSRAAQLAPDLKQEFAVVPVGDALYGALDDVRNAGWSTLSTPAASPANSTPANQVLTRYEMALETAKAIIAVRARANADARWANTLAARAPAAVKGLRALCLAFPGELSRFNIDAGAMATQLAAWLQTPAEMFAAPVLNRNFNTSFHTSSASSNAFDLSELKNGAAPALELPLSQRLRVYAAVASMARAQSDPFPFSREGRTSVLASGAALNLTRWLRVRAQFSSEGQTRGDSILPFSFSSNASSTPSLNAARDFSSPSQSESLSGDLEVALRSNLLLSGEIAQLHSQNLGVDNWLASPQGNNFQGTKIEGGLNFSGWQNRVALSAHLARLVPEDSLAVATTAAQFNVGIGLSQQVSLNLLYRQLFENAANPTRQPSTWRRTQHQLLKSSF